MVTSPRPLNVKLLSDSQLLDVFRSNPQNPELREEVFQRCLFKIRWVVQAYVFERGICPPEHDRYAFCDAVIDRAFEWLTRKIDEAPDKFDSWLGSLARYALISEYRSESGGVINPKLIELPGGQWAGEKASGEFVSKHWVDPTQVFGKTEYADLIKAALEIHAEESRKGRESAFLVQERIEYADRTLEQVASKHKVTVNDVARVLSHDCRSLKRILEDNFDITVQDLHTE